MPRRGRLVTDDLAGQGVALGGSGYVFDVRQRVGSVASGGSFGQVDTYGPCRIGLIDCVRTGPAVEAIVPRPSEKRIVARIAQ